MLASGLQLQMWWPRSMPGESMLICDDCISELVGSKGYGEGRTVSQYGA